jgi:hypothetical protein
MNFKSGLGDQKEIFMNDRWQKVAINEMKDRIKNNFNFVASPEDDKKNYQEIYSKIEGEWKETFNFGDYLVYENGDHYLVNDCGIECLYQKKSSIIPDIIISDATMPADFVFSTANLTLKFCADGNCYKNNVLISNDKEIFESMKEFYTTVNTSHHQNKKFETIAKIFAKCMFYGNWKWETPNERVMEMLMREVGLYPFENEDKMIKTTEVDEQLFKESQKLNCLQKIEKRNNHI